MRQAAESVFTIVLLMLLITPAGLFAQDLPMTEGNAFTASGRCERCHAPGPPNLEALRSPTGEDISPVSQWRSTMMANSSKDPYWQAKVTAEVAEMPALQALIEDKCTTCHAPMGRTEAFLQDSTHQYSLAEAQQDTLAIDGVSCTLCHQIKDTNLGRGDSFSGGYHIENDRLIYGPYDNMVQFPMVTWVHYLPVYGAQVKQSELCATCHTLFAPTVDYSGNIVGEIPEQTPYLEWKNSVYPAQQVECQTCHMPDTGYPVAISTDPDSLPSYQPYGQHYFVGGNTFMLKMLKAHGNEIGVTAGPAAFDSTINRTRRLLRNETVVLQAGHQWISSDSLEVRVAVRNKAGHKLPTGYPSRRAWVYLAISDNGGQPLFVSGDWNPVDGEINGVDMPFEPHHDIITGDDQVQIYQAITHDVNNEVTYSLFRAAGYLKDNRLPPQGFSSQGVHYDSTAVFGNAAADPNFNRTGSSEGSATDTIIYRLGGLDRSASPRLTVKFYYQSIDPRSAGHLFSYNSPEITTFQGYYNQADKSPELLDSLSFILTPTSITETSANLPRIPLVVDNYPNPFNPETTIRLVLKERGSVSLVVYNLLGEAVANLYKGPLAAGTHRLRWNAGASGRDISTGIYLLQATLNRAGASRFRTVRKIIYMK